MRVAVVDDEQQEQERLKEYLTRFANENDTHLEVDLFHSGDALLQDYRLIYDVLFLDVEMPHINGIDAARRIREKDENVTIFFVTNMAQYAVDAFEVQAADYLLKPVKYPDFSMKFRRALKRIARRTVREMRLETVEGERTVKISDILYVKALEHYVVYHVQSGAEIPLRLMVRGNMAEQEALLRPYTFYRTHKSYIVNLTWIEMIQGNKVTVQKIELPVGRTYKKELMSAWLKFGQTWKASERAGDGK